MACNTLMGSVLAAQGGLGIPAFFCISGSFKDMFQCQAEQPRLSLTRASATSSAWASEPGGKMLIMNVSSCALKWQPEFGWHNNSKTLSDTSSVWFNGTISTPGAGCSAKYLKINGNFNAQKWCRAPHPSWKLRQAFILQLRSCCFVSYGLCSKQNSECGREFCWTQNQFLNYTNIMVI